VVKSCLLYFTAVSRRTGASFYGVRPAVRLWIQRAPAADITWRGHRSRDPSVSHHPAVWQGDRGRSDSSQLSTIRWLYDRDIVFTVNSVRTTNTHWSTHSLTSGS